MRPQQLQLMAALPVLQTLPQLLLQPVHVCFAMSHAWSKKKLLLPLLLPLLPYLLGRLVLRQMAAPLLLPASVMSHGCCTFFSVLAVWLGRQVHLRRTSSQMILLLPW